MSRTPLYTVRKDMLARCYKPKTKNYKYYGARGITVCTKWRDSFEEFAKWAFDNGYKPGLEIDRINNDRGYFPKNCRWITHAVNMRNRRKPHVEKTYQFD